jgi:hypothetical protein
MSAPAVDADDPTEPENYTIHFGPSPLAAGAEPSHLPGAQSNINLVRAENRHRYECTLPPNST